MLTALLTGLGLSLLGLVPGLHVVAWLPAIFLWLGGEHALVTGAVFIGSATVLQILHATYHPVAASMLASADVPAKLAYHGFGRAVVANWRNACLFGLTSVLILSAGVVVPELAGFPLMSTLASVLKPVMPLLLLGILGLIIGKSSNPLATLTVCALAGTAGFIAFTVLKDTAMTPLLSGLFGLPAALALLTDEHGDPIPANGTYPTPNPLVSDDEFKGALAGILTGLLAGVGTGSLVAVLRQDGMDPMRYVRLSAGADMGNNVFALLLFAATGATRSGVAAGMAEAGVGRDPITLLIAILGVILGCWFGAALLGGLEPGYHKLTNAMPSRLIGGALALVILAGCWHAAGLGGLLLAGTATMLSSLAKSWTTPNQALLTALMGPALLSGLGLTLAARTALGV